MRCVGCVCGCSVNEVCVEVTGCGGGWVCVWVGGWVWTNGIVYMLILIISMSTVCLV